MLKVNLKPSLLFLDLLAEAESGDAAVAVAVVVAAAPAAVQSGARAPAHAAGRAADGASAQTPAAARGSVLRPAGRRARATTRYQGLNSEWTVLGKHSLCHGWATSIIEAVTILPFTENGTLHWALPSWIYDKMQF